MGDGREGGGGGGGGGSDDDDGGAGRGEKRQAYAPSTLSLRSKTSHGTVSSAGNGDDGDDAADWESGIATLGLDEKNDLYAGVDFDPKGDALTPVGYVNLMCKLNLTEMVAVIVTEAGPRVELEMEELNVHVMKVKETVGESTDVNLSVQYLIVRDKATALTDTDNDIDGEGAGDGGGGGGIGEGDGGGDGGDGEARSYGDRDSNVPRGGRYTSRYDSHSVGGSFSSTGGGGGERGGRGGSGGSGGGDRERGFSFLTGRPLRADAGRESESPFGPGAAAEPGSIELFAFDPKPLSFPPKFGPRWRPPLGMIVHHKTHMTRFKVRYEIKRYTTVV